jgi:pimeloyl-ACP methyl ester carboxylesterase
MQRALACAALCVESYDDDCPPGFLDIGDLRFGIRETLHGPIVAIRGTANLGNALRDIWVRPARTPWGAWAHRGFVSGFAGLEKLLGIPPKGAIFTGHSFGAAVALLFAEAYNAPVVTFGCPRVYLRWGKAPVHDHTRFICDDDPVPMIPRIFYRHLCEPIILDDADGGIDVADHAMTVYHRRLANLMIAPQPAPAVEAA